MGCPPHQRAHAAAQVFGLSAKALYLLEASSIKEFDL